MYLRQQKIRQMMTANKLIDNHKYFQPIIAAKQKKRRQNVTQKSNTTQYFVSTVT